MRAIISLPCLPGIYILVGKTNNRKIGEYVRTFKTNVSTLPVAVSDEKQYLTEATKIFGFYMAEVFKYI